MPSRTARSQKRKRGEEARALGIADFVQRVVALKEGTDAEAAAAAAVSHAVVAAAAAAASVTGQGRAGDHRSLYMRNVGQ